jgi:hypothetical protein
MVVRSAFSGLLSSTMNKCTFVYNDGKYTCAKCGRTITAPEGSIVVAYCKAQYNTSSQPADRPDPPLYIQAAHYAQAVTRHVLTGAQTRTDEEVQRLLLICQSCPRYNQQRGYCTVCGCRCNANRNAFTNKVRMASQDCPLNKWE